MVADHAQCQLYLFQGRIDFIDQAGGVGCSRVECLDRITHAGQGARRIIGLRGIADDQPLSFIFNLCDPVIRCGGLVVELVETVVQRIHDRVDGCGVELLEHGVDLILQHGIDPIHTVFQRADCGFALAGNVLTKGLHHRFQSTRAFIQLIEGKVGQIDLGQALIDHPEGQFGIFGTEVIELVADFDHHQILRSIRCLCRKRAQAGAPFERVIKLDHIEPILPRMDQIRAGVARSAGFIAVECFTNPCVRPRSVAGIKEGAGEKALAAIQPAAHQLHAGIRIGVL